MGKLLEVGRRNMQRVTPSRQAEIPVSGERIRAEILKLKKQESDPESSPAAPTKRVRWQSFPVEINELASVAEPAGFQVAELPADSDVLPPALADREGGLTGSPEFLLEWGEDEPPRGKQRKALAESWRISFSHIEKQMIKNHGKNKTCCESPATTCYSVRKVCLRLLKCLIQSLKERHPAELSHLCSYHGKTAFLHSLCRRCLDSHWQGQLDLCFMQLLDDFITHVEKADLPHFFISNCNLFSPRCFPKRSLELLREELLEQRRLGLTVFQLPCAEEEPALIPAAPAPQQALSNTLLFGILLLLGAFLAAVASLPLQGPV
ncbi:UNVERIFIED_CONTAM: hypothetical protein FKN15_070140 [Acipenser sinensis]